MKLSKLACLLVCLALANLSAGLRSSDITELHLARSLLLDPLRQRSSDA